MLYFYPRTARPAAPPKAWTSTRCCPSSAARSAEVLGRLARVGEVAPQFLRQQGFKFDLVSDAERSPVRAFGVIKPKKLYGRDYIGVERSTFLIDPAGRVVETWRVRVPGHAEAVLCLH
ncbi:MAG: redoxin domain-containing protein [Chiayiivirga sp.]|nr:redoxin domain-containing protein [Chiayiivirga sp.]